MQNETSTNRRSMLRAGALTGAALVAGGTSAFAEEDADLSRGDVAILRFLAAAEIIESDLWVQYNELGGVQDSERPLLGGGGSPAYTAALQNLDGDMPLYIHDNTDDELSHWHFLNAYLASKGESPVDLDSFRTLPGSRATGARQVGRLTNLMEVVVDTSWYTRYRADRHNPDTDPEFRFPQAIPSLAAHRFPAIPRSDADLSPAGHVQAIANTAAFHFCLIEQGGASLYATLAQQVRSVEVLRILLSIGPTEACHYQVWVDKAGNALQPPLAPLVDPSDPRLVFPNLNAKPFGDELFTTNRIFAEPCPFLDRALPPVSIVRPTGRRQGGAVAAVTGLTAQGCSLGRVRTSSSFSTISPARQTRRVAATGPDETQAGRIHATGYDRRRPGLSHVPSGGAEARGNIDFVLTTDAVLSYAESVVAAPSLPGIADLFAEILGGLCRTVAAKMARNPALVPLLMLLHTRLRRTIARLAALAARAANGPLLADPKPAGRPRGSAGTRPELPRLALPRGVGWLIRLLPHEAACYGGQLQHLMAQPDFAALLQAAPQAGRMLRPLCRMLAIPPPPARPAGSTPATPPPNAPAAEADCDDATTVSRLRSAESSLDQTDGTAPPRHFQTLA